MKTSPAQLHQVLGTVPGQNRKMITMSVQEAQALLRPALDQLKKDAFNDDYHASDEEAMGILLARFFEWDGLALLYTAVAALEDANLHTAASAVGELAAKERAL
jgi:hypothetical protein